MPTHFFFVTGFFGPDLLNGTPSTRDILDRT